jgi:hypothetical protein
MFVATGRKRVELRRLILAPETYHTLFLMLDRPPDGEIGSSFDLSIVQSDSKSRGIRGGLDLRIDLVPNPKTKVAVAGRRKPARARGREIERPAVRA